jgi:cytochrome c556
MACSWSANGRVGIALAAALWASVVGSPSAQESKPTLIQQRQEAMKANLAATRIAEQMASGTRPWNRDVARQIAIRFNTVAQRIPELFSPASLSEPGETAALPVIWESHADFLSLAAQLDVESRRLFSRANANDQSGFAAQFLVVDAVCSSCHNKFRKP